MSASNPRLSNFCCPAKTGATILLVEQNFHAAQAIGDSVLVMDNGKIVHRGEMAALATDTALQENLLGLSLETHQ